MSTDIDELTGDYTIDPIHSSIGFVARHAMITKVRGTFDEFDGHLHVEAADPSKSSAKVTIKVASIDTRNADRDAHLRTNDFFAMDEYPEILFESTSVEPVDDTTFRVTGDLTIRGVTRPLTFDLEYNGSAIDPFGNHRVGFEGSVQVNRKDWGITWNAPLELGGVIISDKVTLEFDISAIKNT
jgi:polyisoprenoid-binding protein YceI